MLQQKQSTLYIGFREVERIVEAYKGGEGGRLHET